jgi:glycosyltransferase involved in cell wall biosynthesis
MFSRLQKWEGRVIAADRNLLDGNRVAAEGVLETVRVTPYSGNGSSRIINWVSYAVTAFVRALGARPLDVVYGSSPHLLAAFAGWTVSWLRRVPFVLEVRDVWPRVLVEMGTMSDSSMLYRLLTRLEHFLYRRADRIVILAAGVRAHIEACGVHPDRIVFIPNGADSDDFTASAPREELRDRYRFQGVVAVYAGAHGPANGLDLVLDAATELQETTPTLTIVLVGDGLEKQRLVARAEQERISNVRFLDPIPKSKVRDLLAAADIGLHCLADVDLFRTGVSPNKLYDYMAAGLPTITNTLGEVADFVNGSEGGLAVEPTGLAGGLSRLTILSQEERSQLGISGRAHLAATRSRTAMARLVEFTLDDVLESRS